MTACVNKKHSRRVAAAVSASLVGALTLGAAPAVVLATEAPVEQQVAGDAFSRGEVALTGGGVTKDARNMYTTTADKDGKALEIKATTVTPLGADPITVDDSYTVSYYKADDDFNKVGDAISAIVEPGKYLVAVSDGKGGEAVAKVNVKGATLTGITYYEADADDPYAVSDQDLIFTGKALDVRFQVSGVYLVEGEDYSVKILKKGTDEVADAPVDEVLEAGDYVGYVTGIGQYAGETDEVEFTVNAFTFSASNVTVDDVIGSNTKPAHPTKVTNGETGSKYAELDPSLVDLVFVKGTGGEAGAENNNTGSLLFDKTGSYEFSAIPNEDQVKAKNITDSSSSSYAVTVNKVAKAAKFLYDGEAVQDYYLVNLAEGEKFDNTKVSVLNGDKKLTQTTDYRIIVNGAAAGAYGNLIAGVPGTYEVEVRVIPGSSNVSYAVGGSVTFTVKVVEDVVDADATVYIYDKDTKQAITSFTKAYDGTTIYAGGKFQAKMFDEDGEPITDSSMKLILCDSEGNPLSSGIKDAGSYILKVTSTNYELTGTTEIPVTIAKVDLSELKLFSLKEWGGAEYLPQKLDSSDKPQEYIWDEIDVRYNTGVADDDKTDTATDGKAWESLRQTADFNDLDKSLTLEKWDDEEGEWVKQSTSADKCKEEGLYRITVSGTKAQARNYTFANDDNTTSVEFRVVNPNKLVFTDVAPGSWYFESVYTAQYYKIMNGYSGTKVFGPASPITRGQVAVVLYNMAVGNPNSAELVDETKLSYNEVRGYDTGFDDVDGHAYYAKAIAWAEQAGVVNGYADGTFHADQEVTRQEFACMLANYAELLGEDVQGAEADLSGFADASQVAPFAEESVEWAVANKVMGNGGSIAPGAWISRAEAAAMAVNYAYAE